jgi:23S rRNA (uracil1939-C5)-methyltransferase
MSKRRRNRFDPTPFDCAITDLASDGRGIARVDGKVVFVADALPGERVRAKRHKAGKQADEAVCLQVLEASPERVAPACPHFGVCGGCVLQHLAPEAQRRFKQHQLAEAFRRIGEVTPEAWAEPMAGPVWGYRRRARLGVKHVPAKGGTLVGFRERGSPFLAVLQGCEVLDPRVGRHLGDIGAMIDRLSIRERIPQIEVAATDRVALVFRVLALPTAADREVMARFGRSMGYDIWLQSGGIETAVPLGEAPLPRFSPDGGPRQLALRPTDFIQINGELATAMVHRALDWLGPVAGRKVLELFAGLGNFTLPLAAAGAEVTAVEGETGLVARGRGNTEAAGLSVDWQCADLFGEAGLRGWQDRRFDAALLDPPRAGAREVLPALAASGVRRVVYISCHPATLARDAGILAHEYGFRLERAGVMDMFPHTAHVESMALLTR